jgi:hypothetical protein
MEASTYSGFDLGMSDTLQRNKDCESLMISSGNR